MNDIATHLVSELQYQKEMKLTAASRANHFVEIRGKYLEFHRLEGVTKNYYLALQCS